MHFQPRSKIKKFKENLREKGEFESTMALDPGRNIGLNPDQVKNKLRILAKIFLLEHFVDYYLRHHSPSSCFAFNAGCGVKRRMGNMRG